MDEELEIFKGKLCDCSHPAHGNNKCYDMNFNGTVWSNCRCTKTSQDFCFILSPEDFQNVSRIYTDRRKFAKAA